MSGTVPQIDPYSVLGVTAETPFDEIRIVHRRLVRELHPDVNPDARARFDAVQEAFAAIRALHNPRLNMPSAKLDPSGRITTGAISPTPVDVDNDMPFVFVRPQVPPAGARGSGPVQAGQQAGATEIEPPSAAVPQAGNGSGADLPDATAPLDDTGPLSTGPLSDESEAIPAPPGRSEASQLLLRRAPIKPERPAEPAVRRPTPERSPGPATPEAPVQPQIQPQSGTPLTISVTPGKEWGHAQPTEQMLYYLLDFTLAAASEAATQQLNLMLVLDHSSSMGRGDKMMRLKEAVARIIDLMGPEDRLGIVMFGDRASVLLPSTKLGDKRLARSALDGFRSHGGTEISTGLRLGLHELRHRPGKQVAGILLLTDGQTYGDEETCLELAKEAGERSVQITALGLGDDWNSALLDAIAARSGGQACYVPSAEALAAVFESQVRTLQLALVRNVSMFIRPLPACRVLRATWVAPTIAYHAVPAQNAAGQTVELDLGRLSTNRSYRLLIETVVTAPSPGTQLVANVLCTYDAPTLGISQGSAQCTLSATLVDASEPEPAVHSRIMDALRKITAHRLQEQAMQAIEEGQTLKGTASLRTAAKHLEDAGHADLAALVRAEAGRAERVGTTQPAAMKHILYGTRGLG